MKPPKNGDLTASIDWLEFTVLGLSVADVVAKILELPADKFSTLDKGRFGYRQQTKWADGNVFLMFNPVTADNDDLPDKVDRMGVHVMLTGSGCRQYEVHHQIKRLMIFLAALDEKVNFSRIDLAIDDVGERLIEFSRIHSAAIKCLFTSRWSRWDEVNSRQSADGEFLGRTMYFGSQASDIFCRIYDKALERKRNGDDDVEYPDKWTRLEIVYRKDRARKLAYHLVDHDMEVGTAVRGTLKQYVRFLKPSSDSNKSRWPTADWWEQLLAGVE